MARPPQAKRPGRVQSFLLLLRSTQVNCWLDTMRVRLPSATLLCTPFVIKSNFCPAMEASHFFSAIGTRLNRKSPARKSETSKQVSGEATLLIWAPVAALVAVASNVGPGPSAGRGSTNVSGVVVDVATGAVVGLEELVVELEEELAAEAEVTAEGGLAGGMEATAMPFPTNQVCSGEKLGGEQGLLLRKPSALRVRHWLPGPTPLLTASRT